MNDENNVDINSKEKTEQSFNIYEFLEVKMKDVTDKIAEILLEGDAYFDEWEAISKLLADINKFLEFLKNKK